MGLGAEAKIGTCVVEAIVIDVIDLTVDRGVGNLAMHEDTSVSFPSKCVECIFSAYYFPTVPGQLSIIAWIYHGKSVEAQREKSDGFWIDPDGDLGLVRFWFLAKLESGTGQARIGYMPAFFPIRSVPADQDQVRKSEHTLGARTGPTGSFLHFPLFLLFTSYRA